MDMKATQQQNIIWGVLQSKWIEWMIVQENRCIRELRKLEVFIVLVQKLTSPCSKDLNFNVSLKHKHASSGVNIFNEVNV